MVKTVHIRSRCLWEALERGGNSKSSVFEILMEMKSKWSIHGSCRIRYRNKNHFKPFSTQCMTGSAIWAVEMFDSIMFIEVRKSVRLVEFTEIIITIKLWLPDVAFPIFVQEETQSSWKFSLCVWIVLPFDWDSVCLHFYSNRMK